MVRIDPNQDTLARMLRSLMPEDADRYRRLRTKYHAALEAVGFTLFTHEAFAVAHGLEDITTEAGQRQFYELVVGTINPINSRIYTLHQLSHELDLEVVESRLSYDQVWNMYLKQFSMHLTEFPKPGGPVLYILHDYERWLEHIRGALPRMMDDQHAEKRYRELPKSY